MRYEHLSQPLQSELSVDLCRITNAARTPQLALGTQNRPVLLVRKAVMGRKRVRSYVRFWPIFLPVVTGRKRPILLKKAVLRQPVGQVHQLLKWLQATSNCLSALH